MKLAILGRGHVATALLPILERDTRFTAVGIHSRSHPMAATSEQFINESGADVLVELTTLNPTIGEPAVTHIRAAFARGMHVVTANKGPIAHAYHDLASEAASRGLLFRFESTVMDGAPVFNQFRNNMPGVRVLGFAGALNSTSKIVIETVESGGSFEDGIAKARQLGIAEADASYDLDGWDSAAKTAALANVLLDARVTPLDVEREGIGGYSEDQIREIAREGKTIRLISRAGKGKLQAKAEILAKTDILATAGGTSNIILFETDRMGTWGTVSIAPGVEQTAYGVYVDLVSILSA